MIHDLLIAPFTEFEFMRRALVGASAIALAGAPLGVFLLLRRMSLTGDAMAHAILPGAALGYLVAGLSLPAMTIGGLAAGLSVALLAGLVARVTALREDASLAGFYLISLALGVTIVSLRGSSVDLLHVLFCNVLALEPRLADMLAPVGAAAQIAGKLFAIGAPAVRSRMAAARVAMPCSMSSGPRMRLIQSSKLQIPMSRRRCAPSKETRSAAACAAATAS